ncbi:uncharacterized protein V6R79_016543 [Siganus canaliculatus]
MTASSANGRGRSSLLTLSFRLSDSRSNENKQRIMMVNVKWIQVALFLAAVLQFSAVSERRELITREGERVALPCDSVLPDQPECGFTTWTVSEPGQVAKELVQHGKIEPDEEHRLEMKKNCSLVIKKVTVEDVGHYECRQYRDSNDPPQSAVSLSVVSITQEQSGNMEFICSVRTYGNFEFTVSWWFNGQKAVETPPSTCSAIFPKTSQTKGSYECEVTDGVNKKLFPFSPRASGEEPEETPAKPAPEKPEPGKPAPGKPAPGKPSSADEASSEPPELNVSKFTTLRQTEVFLFQLKMFLCGLFSREPGTSCFESCKKTKSDAFRSSCQSGKDLIRLSDSRSHENEQRIMMVDFKWIQVALFLAAVLQFSAVSEGRKLITREGERVALPCDNVLPDQHGCEFTTWITSGSGKAAKELVQHGKIIPHEEHRLEMTKNCSLVIKEVTVKDVGHYECQQYRDSKKISQTAVFLSVVSITQGQSGNMEFICSVRTEGRCRFTVRWWFNGQKAVEKPSSTCSAIFPKTSQTKGSYECEVTDGVNKKLFPFSPRASGEEPGLLLPFVIVPLVLAALVVVVVMVIRWKRAKGNKTQINQRDGLNSNPAEAQPSPGRGQEMADPEDGVSYATISFNKNKASRSKVQVLGQDDDDDGTVTYSRVKPGNDFSNMYATVNKPNK